MAAFALIAGITGAAAALSLVAGRARWGWIWAAVCAAVGVGALYALSPPPSPLAMASEPAALRLTLTVGWFVYGALLRESARPTLGRHLGTFAVFAGALMGDLTAAALIAGMVADKRLAARAALVASASGMLTGVGTVATLMLASPSLVIIPAALAIVVAWPRGVPVDPYEGRQERSHMVFLIAALSMFHASIALLVGIAVIGWRTRFAGLKHLQWRPLVLLIAVSLATWAAWRSGALWSAEWGIAWLASRAPGLAEPLLFLASALVSALGGEPAAAFIGGEILSAPLYPRFSELAVPMAAGLGLGGLGPLLIVGGWRAGWRVWLGQLTVGAIWAAAWGVLR